MTATPQKLGRYEILEEIGKGAMGVVYLARDPLIGRLVALKTFRVGFAARDEELLQFRSRFVREAQSAGILSHPNIVTIHDVVDEGPGGICFIAMEYVKGTNLKQLLQRPDPFPLNFVVDVLAQVAEALDYAHSRGVVHRDVKPANILITPDNRVKITDFGIARMDTSNLTMEGQLLGTPNYMAPEQIQGRELDHRADIFSLGVVFYEMLTRRKPFQGENMTAVTHKIVFESFTPPEEFVRDLPKGFSTILTRCLEKDPNRRYPRASELARELRAVLQVQQTLDDTVGTQEVDPIAEAPVAAPSASPPELAPTRMVERPALPPAPPSGPAIDAAAPTRMVERPPIPPAPPAKPVEDGATPTRLVERPPIPQAPKPAAPVEAGPTRIVARPTAPSRSTPPAAAPATGGPGVSPTAATMLTAIPKGGSQPVSAPPPAAPVATAPARATKAAAGGRKWILVAAAAVLVFAVAALASLWLRRPPAAPPLAEQPAPAPSPEQQSHVTAAGAVAEARTQLAQGNLDGALQAVARAELAEPGSREILALRQEIEARRQEVADAEKQSKIDQLTRNARYAFAEKRYSDAASSAKGVLALDPSNDEAKKILADASGAAKRLRERQQAAEVAAAAPPPVVAPAPAPAPVVDPEALKVANLQIDFASERSEGVLTIYVGDRQILRESFKFLRKTGFLAREKTSGTIQAIRRLPAGPVALRVYVALASEATRAISLEGHLPGAVTTRLEIRVAANGNATAQLR